MFSMNSLDLTGHNFATVLSKLRLLPYFILSAITKMLPVTGFFIEVMWGIFGILAGMAIADYAYSSLYPRLLIQMAGLGKKNNLC